MTTGSHTHEKATATASATADASKHLGQVAGQEAGNVAGGRSALNKTSPALPETQRSLKEDAQWARQQKS